MLKHINIKNLESKEALALKLVYYSISIFIILRASYTAILLNSTDSSLWLDEAMLAYAFSTRSIEELTSNIFSWNQSAPILYLYIVKVITLIFGNSETTLRIWSLITYTQTLLLSYYILSQVVKTKYPLLAVAFISNMTIMLAYSYEFKPYMSDAASVLIVVVCYHLYVQRKIRQIVLYVLFACLIWLSNPSAFFIGAVLLLEFYQACKNRNRTDAIGTLLGGFIILLSFIIYYYYWLKPVIDIGYMNEFWAHRRFPLIPLSLTDLKAIQTITKDLIWPFRGFRFIIMPIVLAGIFVNILKTKNRYISILYLGILITLCASMLGMFPIHDRLCLFIYPLFVILFFATINSFLQKNLILNLIIVALPIWAILSTRGSKYFSEEKNIHKEYGNEATNFMERNIKEGETAFIFYQMIPVYSYHKKFDLENLHYPLILAENNFGTFSKDDMNKVLDNAPIYLLVSSIGLPYDSISPLVDSLRSKGEIDLIYNKRTSLVYYFSKNENTEKVK